MNTQQKIREILGQAAPSLRHMACPPDEPCREEGEDSLDQATAQILELWKEELYAIVKGTRSPEEAGIRAQNKWVELAKHLLAQEDPMTKRCVLCSIPWCESGEICRGQESDHTPETSTNKDGQGVSEAPMSIRSILEDAAKGIQHGIKKTFLLEVDRDQAETALNAYVEERELRLLKEFRPGKDTDIEHLQHLFDTRIAKLEEKD